MELAGTTCAVGQMLGQPAAAPARRATGNAATVVHIGAVAVPAATAMVNATSSVSSAKICSGEPVARLSSVGSTDPSIEFSIGTQA